MSEEPVIDPKLLDEIAQVFEGSAIDLQFESLFKMLVKVGILLGEFRKLLEGQGFSEEWIEVVSMSVFNRLFGVTETEEDYDVQDR